MSDDPTITIPRDMFERLVDHAIELHGEWSWKQNERRPGYRDKWQELAADIKRACEIRDGKDDK